MKWIMLVITTFLTGCYLANGSPSPATYWVKNGKSISYEEAKKCYIQSKGNILNKFNLDRFNYLEDKYNKNPIKMIDEYKNEYSEYIHFLDAISILNRECFYHSGYRFRAPIQWCLAQDGDNTKICIDNMKYRN